MESLFLKIFNYLLLVFKATSLQIFFMLGPLLFLAVIMNLLSSKSEELGLRVFGQKFYTYGFSWLGTAVHELGHAAFAVIFGHKINKMVLFSPNPSKGTMGYLSHSYNRKNIYHNIGNFFIGIGPIIFGTIVMYSLAYIFLGNYIKMFSANFTIDAVEDIVYVLQKMFIELKSSGWKSILLLYVLYSIGSSITLSKSDISGAKQGFIFFTIVIFMFNLVTIWLGNEGTRSIVELSEFMSGIYIMLVFSIILNLVFIVFLYMLNIIKSIFNLGLKIISIKL